jgi:hypothetical protein
VIVADGERHSQRGFVSELCGYSPRPFPPSANRMLP